MSLKKPGQDKKKKSLLRRIIPWDGPGGIKGNFFIYTDFFSVFLI